MQYTWQPAEGDLASLARAILRLALRNRRLQFAFALYVFGGVFFATSGRPYGAVVAGVVIAVTYAGQVRAARVRATALFGGQSTWTATYGPDGIEIENAQGAFRAGYAEFGRHQYSEPLHTWLLTRHRRLYLPAALVPPEALTRMELGNGSVT